MSDDLSQFLRETQDARTYKRALAVQLALQNRSYAEIAALLQVSTPFISKWKRSYREQGVTGLQIGHYGSVRYLAPAEREQVITWLKAQAPWDIPTLRTYLATHFDVVYKSLQSYYALLQAAGLSWKKTQAQNPKKTPQPWLPNGLKSPPMAPNSATKS